MILQFEERNIETMEWLKFLQGEMLEVYFNWYPHNKKFSQLSNHRQININNDIFI